MNKGKISINPYLNFPGNCKQAMNFYKDIFNGKLDLMPFEGSPLEVPDDYKKSHFIARYPLKARSSWPQTPCLVKRWTLGMEIIYH